MIQQGKQGKKALTNCRCSRLLQEDAASRHSIYTE